jgi:hypothetical protein
MRPSNASCGEVEYVCRNYPDVEGCTVSVCAIYLLLALEWYNNFLKRITKLHIDNMETVYSKIMNQSEPSSRQVFPLDPSLDVYFFLTESLRVPSIFLLPVLLPLPL